MSNLQQEVENQSKQKAQEKVELMDLLRMQKERYELMSDELDKLFKSQTGLADTIICVLEVLDINQALNQTFPPGSNQLVDIRQPSVNNDRPQSTTSNGTILQLYTRNAS